MVLNNDDIILFAGDSITAAGRVNLPPPYQLAGYTAIIADALRAGGLTVTAYNRGLGGDTSAMLLARIERELAEARPTVFSLLIGINDVWRKFDRGTPTSHADFAQNVSGILRAAKQYADRIIVLEPFLFDVDPQKERFIEDLAPKIRALRTLSRKYGAEYIALDGAFAELSVEYGSAKYSTDGVHLTHEGNEVIACRWLEKIGIEYEG